MTVNFPSHSLFNEIKNNTNNKKISEDKRRKDIQRTAEEGLLTLSAAFGLYYFAKYRNLKQIVKETKNGRVQSETPIFTTQTATCENTVFSNPVASADKKPKWNAQVSGYTSPSATNTTRPKPPLKKEIPGSRQSLQDVIPQSKIREIITDIKLYMERSGIDSKNKKINPEALDEILTRTVGKENVKERPFKPAECMSRGRVKEYKAPNGRVYILETHLHKEEGYVTRLYLAHRDRDLRVYLHPDGSFRLNSYGMSLSHFETTAKGKRWMENSPFLTGKKD